MFWFKSCPRCHGDLHLVREVGDHYVSCLQCGRILTSEQEIALPGFHLPARRPLKFRAREAVTRTARIAA
jgi:hypothetical protein